MSVVLLDIEGTIPPPSFVLEVLFPLAAARLRMFVEARLNEPAIRGGLESVKATVRAEDGNRVDDAIAIDQLLHWIRSDRKHPALKDLQGRIWQDAYVSGDLVAPLYPDVVPAVDRYRAAGHRVAIYSSGSILAQQLFLRYSSAGDVTSRVSGWFDLSSGPKGESSSYVSIAASLDVAIGDVVFFTDSPTEVRAAIGAGVVAIHVVRPDAPQTRVHTGARTIGSFDEVPTLP